MWTYSLLLIVADSLLTDCLLSITNYAYDMLVEVLIVKFGTPLSGDKVLLRNRCYVITVLGTQTYILYSCIYVFRSPNTSQSPTLPLSTNCGLCGVSHSPSAGSAVQHCSRYAHEDCKFSLSDEEPRPASG